MVGWRGNPHFGPFHIFSDVFIGGGFWLLSASWPPLYQAQKGNQLAASGLYAKIRHPQYVAFVLVMFGFLLQWPTILTLAMFPILVIMYWRLAKAEERDSLAAFGDRYTAYIRMTLAFVARLRPRRDDGPYAPVPLQSTRPWRPPVSSTSKTIPLRRQEAAARPAIPMIALGLSLSIFFAVSFLLRAVADLIPWLQDFHFLKALYPDIDWARPEMIGAGTVWAFLSGWYVALAFGSLYNHFVAPAR